MKYTTNSVGTTPEILKRKLGAEFSKPITLHTSAFTGGVCKAGTPIDKDGKVANTASAVGILWNDVYDSNPNGSLIVAYAVINLANAEANSGLEIADAVKSALDVKFE